MNLDDLYGHLDELDVRVSEKSNSIESECPFCETFGKGKFLIRKGDGRTVCFRGSCDYGVKSFSEFYSIVADIPIEKAKNIISGRTVFFKDRTLNLNLDSKPEDVEIELKPISWPPDRTYPINDHGGEMGREYLESRGISADIASEYKIRFSINDRRVIFPVFMNNICYGYQARSIDPVDPSFRMLNNSGFKRAHMIMFLDRLRNSDHVIVTEGPIDAIKFHKAGGNICTMGKNISNNQLELITKTNPKAVYLAMDDDAAPVMRWIEKKINIPCFLVEVPDSAKSRCKKNNKKADFGECTLEECRSAFLAAKPFNRYTTVLHLGDS